MTRRREPWAIHAAGFFSLSFLQIFALTTSPWGGHIGLSAAMLGVALPLTEKHKPRAAQQFVTKSTNTAPPALRALMERRAAARARKAAEAAC